MRRVAELLKAAWWTRRALEGERHARQWLAGVWYDAGLGEPPSSSYELRAAYRRLRREALELARGQL